MYTTYMTFLSLLILNNYMSYVTRWLTNYKNHVLYNNRKTISIPDIYTSSQTFCQQIAISGVGFKNITLPVLVCFQSTGNKFITSAVHNIIIYVVCKTTKVIESSLFRGIVYV